MCSEHNITSKIIGKSIIYKPSKRAAGEITETIVALAHQTKTKRRIGGKKAKESDAKSRIEEKTKVVLLKTIKVEYD